MERAIHHATELDNVQSLHRRGLACAQRGQFEAAASLIAQAVEHEPDSAEAHNNLGNVLSTLGRYGEAVSHYRRALEINPDFAAAHSNLGAALQGLGRLDAAIESYEAALALAPDHAKAHYNLGNALQAQNRNEAAVACYNAALALEPGNAGGHSNLGSALETLGRVDGARRAFEQAITLAPRQTRYYWDLAACKQFTDDDAHLAAMENLAADATLGGDEQMPLQFALAKALMDTGQHARAFRHLCRGNALKRQRIVYDEAATLESFEHIRRSFSAELMRAHRGAGYPSAAPVFILGMPRSGSSLVEQILASHPEVFGGGEHGAFAAAMAMPDGPSGRAALMGERLRGLGQRYLDRVRTAAPARPRITDKMPGNFRLAGLINLALPNARIIHTRRNPVDTCFSCFTQLFTGEQPYSYELGELGRYYRAYDALMAHWRKVLPEGVMLEIDYEDVVADVEGAARRIVAHCGLDWDEACLRFHETQRPVRTSSAVQVRQRIYQSSVGRARPYEGMLGPLHEALGGAGTEEAPARRRSGGF